MRGMRSAANISASAFSYSLLSGLASNAESDLKVINTPLTGPYPNDYKRIYTKGFVTEEYGINVKTISSCNLYGVQSSSLYNNVYFAMIEIGCGDADILVYSIQLPILHAAVKYKEKHKGSRVILIVPDLYENINTNVGLRQKLKKKLFGDFDELCRSVDGYVLLTEQMIDMMPVKKPYCVVEGIYNPSEKRYASSNLSNHFNVLYTGMLYEKFGVKNLVDAIGVIKDNNIRLQLCGSGDLENYIKEKAYKDSRIAFLGIVPREHVLQLQCDASLLVNPRQPNGGFTQYSFPSKNIEYLASGTPALIYELEGIPKEYYQYCYHLTSNQLEVGDLADMIYRIYNLPKEERLMLAQRAQNFIFTKKNAPTQCDKIIRFIDSL